MWSYRLIRSLQSHNSENHQQKMWMKNQKIVSDTTEKAIYRWDQRRFVFTEKNGSKISLGRKKVGLTLDEIVASNDFRFSKNYDFLCSVLVRGTCFKGLVGDLDGTEIWIGWAVIPWATAGASGIQNGEGLWTVTEEFINIQMEE